MKLTYYGQSCFQLNDGNYDLIIDPFISGNEKAAHIDVDSLKTDFVLLTHGHQDHVLDAEKIARNNDALLISNYEIAEYYGNKGIDTHPMNHGGKKEFDFGKLKYVSAVHSSVLPDGTYAGNPGGFVLQIAGKTIYHSGDTALTMDMKLIPMTCPPLDLAILPVGDNFTMGAEDAAIASDFIDCDNIIGCHFDTFPYIEIDHDRAKNIFKDKGKNFRLMEIGETIEI